MDYDTQMKFKPCRQALLRVILCLIAVALFAPALVYANPFIEGKPAPHPGPLAGLLTMPYMQEILAWQRQIHEAMTTQIEAMRGGDNYAALWGLLLGSFFYGIFHILAPGHGKVIVSSYFLGNRAKIRDGLVAGLIMAVGHSVSAVVIVCIFSFVLGLTQFNALAQARYVELIGYGVITLIGLWLFLQVFIDSKKPACCGHSHGEHVHHHHGYHEHLPVYKNRQAMSLFTATGLVPCTGSMIILFFTLANHVLWAGLLAVAVMAVGMWITASAIGITSIFLRRIVAGHEIGEQSTRHIWLIKGLRVAAALVVIMTGGLLFLGALEGVLQS